MQKAVTGFRRTKLRVLMSRGISFLFIMSLLVILLYIAGSIHGFMDSTQLFLLKLGSLMSLFLSVMALCGLVQQLFLIFRIKTRKKSTGTSSGNAGSFHRKGGRGRRYWGRAVFYMVVIVFGIATALTALFVFAASGGNIV